MREQLKARLRSDNITQINELYLANQFDALDRICSNVHFERNKRTATSTATGLTREEAQIVLSDSTLKYLAEQESITILDRFKRLKGESKKNDDTKL